MDAGDIFNRGDSIPRVVILTYEDTGLPLDLDTLTEITFAVIHAVTGRTLNTYTLSGATIIKQDAGNGIAWFDVGQSVSALAKLGKYFIRVTSTEADGDYESGVHVRKGLGFCFKLQS